jgi:metal-responsive CopG/Arc/MetJ family transcriptional regulator
MPRTPGETKPRQFRLGDETLDTIDRIAAHYGGVSRSDVLRMAVADFASRLPAAPKKNRKNPPKRG